MLDWSKWIILPVRGTKSHPAIHPTEDRDPASPFRGEMKSQKFQNTAFAYRSPILTIFSRFALLETLVGWMGNCSESKCLLKMGGCMGILGVVIFAILTVLSGLWYGHWFKDLSLFLWRNENFDLKFMIRIVHVETCKGIFLMLVQLYLRLCMMHNLCDNLCSMDYKFIKWHVLTPRLREQPLSILCKIYSRNRLHKSDSEVKALFNILSL